MGNRPVAFITGASRGIGRGIALELARSGFDIVGNATTWNPDQKGKGLAEVKAAVEALSASFEPAPGDVASLETHQALLSRALDRFNRVDVLVNNAGKAPKNRLDILETTPESYDEVFALNTRGAFFLSQCFARHMKDQPHHDKVHPSIIFITSISVYISSPTRSAYCMSKAAMSQAARVFADRLAEFGINVYEVRPGITKTDMTAPVADKYDVLIKEGLVPQKRWAYPEDVGRAVASLARGDFRFSTGQVVEVSGGMHIQHL